MAPAGDPLPPPAEPRLGRTFDPWNSSATGHQRAETRGPRGWRESRNVKLQGQLRAGHAGGDRAADGVGSGSGDFDERHGVLLPRDVRAAAKNSVADMLRRPGSMPAAAAGGASERRGPAPEPAVTAEERPAARRGAEGGAGGAGGAQSGEDARGGRKKIFDGLVVYVNGSTHPLISDHKLKRVLAENGARMSLHLGRRQVTHVILGRPAAGAPGRGGGAGGGLAGGKLEKEIRRVGGRGVKYVGAEWVLESLKAGVRLPEARFGGMKVAAKGQPSVLGAFSRAKPPP